MKKKLVLYYSISSLNNVNIDMTSVCLCALIQLFIFYCCLVMLKEEHLRETVKSKVLDRKMNGFMILDFTLM